jgi:MoaA/NifB/PqqE/SkfB family radical SAM enzyme
MDNNFDLQAYLTKGVEHIVSDSLRAVLKDPKETAFMLKFAAASRKASKKRADSAEKGEHIPPFLIASITSSCNLHCAGCYSRCSNATSDTPPDDQLTAEEWLRIFREAEELGISYILLAGGEPLMRRDVINSAASMKNIIFPIFTNGTFINEQYFDTFDKNRNLIPVLSIEGGQKATDARRGKGVYALLSANMDKFREKSLLFGASVTVTTENTEEISSEEFICSLAEKGCKLVIFVEYVPMSPDSEKLAPTDKERQLLRDRISVLRSSHADVVFLSFPGDEKSSGGCIAAGRGFFHINSHGGAEPCPFSPYSDINVRDTSLREAISSRLFTALRSGDILSDDHSGGCVLYKKRAEVETLLGKK